MAHGSLTVPVVLWGGQAPSHSISQLFVMPDHGTVVTGSVTGHVCLWELDVDLKISSRFMLLGHSSAVTCISCAGYGAYGSRCVTASDNGEIILWDTVDGRCLESNNSKFCHTTMKLHTLQAQTDIGDTLLFCCGHYPEICIMDPRSLQIVYTLASRVEPDWIASFCLLRPPKKPVDVVIGISLSCVVKIWTLDVRKQFKSIENLFEDESKQLKRIEAVDVTYCPENQRCMMIVSNDAWMIFDASDFSMLCSVAVSTGEEWVGGCFVALDKVAAWCSNGWCYLYQLPRSASLQQRGTSQETAFKEPLLCCILKPEQEITEPTFSANPCFYNFRMTTTPAAPASGERPVKVHVEVIVRGDSDGELTLWVVPPVSDKVIAALQQEKFNAYPKIKPKFTASLELDWKQSSDGAVGIIDHLMPGQHFDSVGVTTTLYISSQGRLVLGRQDGSILLIAATQSIAKQLLHLKGKPDEWPLHRALYGHRSHVTCLLYPNELHPRYESNLLVSGGSDFCVCLWDLFAGSLIHKFCVQAGAVLKLLVPPASCNNRILGTVCSIASDHSIALLGTKDLRCFLLASKHLFPIRHLFWRPLDDYLVVQCEDKTLYVWQMETGHLDRVVTGVVAEDILQASREQLGSSESDEEVFASPAVQMFRAIRNRNVSAIKKVAEGSTSPSLGGGTHSNSGSGSSLGRQPLTGVPPLAIQGVKTTRQDLDSHLLLFNLEALILELIHEEHGGLREHLSGESTNAAASGAGEAPSLADARKSFSFTLDSNLNMEIAQLLLSFLHSWEMDPDLDRVCLEKLGMLKPKVPLCFGMMSREGYMSLMLPALAAKRSDQAKQVSSFSGFARSIHWQLSPTLTTTHLMGIIAVANTLMSMTNASFLPNQVQKRRMMKRRPSTLQQIAGSQQQQPPQQEHVDYNRIAAESSQIKQGWSLLAALHCVLLPDLLEGKNFQAPRVELLARRWQERCTELRDAAQALLLRELARLGSAGRRILIDRWFSFLPPHLDPNISIFGPQTMAVPTSLSSTTSVTGSLAESVSSSGGEGTTGTDMPDGESGSVLWSAQEMRRNQSTSVVLLGVIGSQYPGEIVPALPAGVEQHRPSVDHSLARAISQCLLELLVHPPSNLLPAFSPLRRAAIDLLGRGFPVWQPYIDISRVLLGLLEFCVNAERLIPKPPVLYPLNPPADTCRTARHALSLIATHRPQAFIIALSKEIARLNQSTQHQGVQSSTTTSSPLPKTKGEVLRIIDVLCDKQSVEVVEMMIPIGEILVFCLDSSVLKQRPLNQVFPAIGKFHMVSYCSSTRRLAFGGKSGSLAIHDLRANKSQTLQAHSKALTATAFSADGKHLASYSADEGKLNFWQTSQGLFGMGQSQIKCVRQLPAPHISSFPAATPGGTPLPFKARLVWISPKAVTLMLPNGKEHRLTMV